MKKTSKTIKDVFMYIRISKDKNEEKNGIK